MHDNKYFLKKKLFLTSAHQNDSQHTNRIKFYQKKLNFVGTHFNRIPQHFLN